ncbi:hypothetical protein GL218_06433 [Daldinia childiae]|uniref:uncharacterized protein n=1 Tax=Daldinia childiae TaxID=326645 RepID=UPI0014487DA4|nr:uncharacterized protein GL218_06433 [Daldinia childiae]KAF3056450.1 hypothetical protein GL218_06433 [Daldinia childiae]
MSGRTARVSPVAADAAATTSTASKPRSRPSRRRELEDMDVDSQEGSLSDDSDGLAGPSQIDPPLEEVDDQNPFASESDEDDEKWTSGDAHDTFDVDLNVDGTVYAYPPNHVAPNPLPPRTLTVDEDMLLASYNGLSRSMQKVAMVFMRQLKSMDKRTSKHVEKARPPLTMIECRKSLEVKYNKYWTREDENDLLDRFSRDPIIAKFDALNVKKNKDILPMWKIIRRFLGCFPMDIISPQNHLRYWKIDVDEDEEVDEDPNWSTSFCRKLKVLALHPVFEFNHNLLTLALQYAVICRKDYRGPIPCNNPITDDFLDMFFARMWDQDGSKSVVRIHREVFAYFVRRRKRLASAMSELMRHIEKRAFRKKNAPFRPAEVPVFKITTRDLNIVTRAANATRPAGVPRFALSVTSRIVLAAQKSHDAPKTLEELNELREKIILRDRRTEIIDKRRSTAEAAKAAEADEADEVEAPRRKRRRERSDVGSHAKRQRVEVEAGEDESFAPIFSDDEGPAAPGPAPGPAPARTPAVTVDSGNVRRKQSESSGLDRPRKPIQKAASAPVPARGSTRVEIVRSSYRPDKGTDATSSSNSTVPKGLRVNLSKAVKFSVPDVPVGKEVSEPYKSPPGCLIPTRLLLGPERNEFFATFQNYTPALEARAAALRSATSDPEPRPQFSDDMEEDEEDEDEEDEDEEKGWMV